MRKDRPHTPDGRYFVARGKLHRCTNPALPDAERRRLIKQLMQARMTVGNALNDDQAQEARSRVDAAKHALGEAGPVWWRDDAPDYSGLDPADTPYSDWWRSVTYGDA